MYTLSSRFKLSVFLFAIMLTIWVFTSSSEMDVMATSEPLKYLSDSINDSTNPEEFPWGEIIEVWVNGDAITIKSKGLMEFSKYDPGAGGQYLLLLFDENLDNCTDVVFTRKQSSFVDNCYLSRPSNHTYYSNGTWNYSKRLFDPNIEEDETSGQVTFHLGEAINGELRLKIASFYQYDFRSVKGWKTGGDTSPDCSWKIEEIISPTYLDNIAKLVNDTRFLYPNETFLLQEPEPPPPPPPPTVVELFFSIISSIQSWITNNLTTTILLSIFSLAAIYSIAYRIRMFINVSLIYFIITALIYASTLQSSLFATVSISMALLAPLYLWYREISDSMSSVLNVQKRLVCVEVLALFLLALAVCLPFSLFSLQLPFGKTPLVYLVVLTIVLIKGNTLGIYGFKTKNLVKSLLIGLAYYLVYGVPFFATIFSLVFIFTGQLASIGYNVFTALLYFPFMTLCVSISEEGLFRGFIQTRLAKVYNRNIALLVQALLFGVWQLLLFISTLNVMGMTLYMFQTIAWGLISGLFYKTSENLIPLILTNGLVNTVLLVTNPLEIYETDPFFSVILGVSISVGLIVQVIFTKYLAKRTRVETEISTQEGVE